MRVALVTVSLFALLGTGLPGQATEAPPATKQLLHRIADAFGMLRTTDEEDMIATLRFWGTGTLMVDGRPCRLASYAASVNYHVPGARIEYACAEAGGKPGPRRVEVVAGSFAWNEEAPGGTATPASASAAERLLDLWTLPHAAVKAAVLAGARTSASTEVFCTSPTRVPVSLRKTCLMSSSGSTKQNIHEAMYRDQDLVSQLQRKLLCTMMGHCILQARLMSGLL